LRRLELFELGSSTLIIFRLEQLGLRSSIIIVCLERGDSIITRLGQGGSIIVFWEQVKFVIICPEYPSYRNSLVIFRLGAATSQVVVLITN